MGKQRSSLRQVPWQSWEHWNWVATELFSDSPDRISGALDRIAAWQSRGKVPIAVESSAAIIGIHHRDPQVKHGILEESALPEELLRMMYAMAIQRLVNGVVDQSRKRNTSSVAERAEFAGLPRLLVDIRHEAAHTELPGLALLQVASKQALAWLKLQYWDQQRETLGNVRLELKTKLVEHCLLVVDILDPRAIPADPRQSRDGLESDSNEEEVRQAVAQEILRAKKQQRNGLLNELLDLSLSSLSNLISTLVDDGLLEQETLPPAEDGDHTKPPVKTSSTDGAPDLLISATDCAWKFTLRHLSSHLPRLPEMLIVAIIKRINNKRSPQRPQAVRGPEDGAPTMSQTSRLHTDDATGPGSEDWFKSRNRLISWCAWLLGRRPVPQDADDSSENGLRKSKLWKLSNSLFLKAELGKDILGEVLRLCLSTSQGRDPLVELVSLLSVQLGNERFQHRVAALAQLGTSMQRSHREIADMSETLEASDVIAGEERRASEGLSFSGPPAGNEPSPGGDLTLDPALEIARSRQRAFLARLSSLKQGASTTRDDLRLNKEPCAENVVTLPNITASHLRSSDAKHRNSPPPTNAEVRQEVRQEGAGVQRWSLVENWRPCAIGMIPSPCHSVGILPCLDMRGHGDGNEQVVGRKRSRAVVSSGETSAAATNVPVKPVDEDNLAAAADRVVAAGKGTTDEHLDGSSTGGKKLKKTGRHVHFEDDGGPPDANPNEKGGAAAIVSAGASPRGPTISTRAGSRQIREQMHSGSLLQGCLLQQGMFMPVTPQQLESLKSAVHVL